MDSHAGRVLRRVRSGREFRAASPSDASRFRLIATQARHRSRLIRVILVISIAAITSKQVAVRS